MTPFTRRRSGLLSGSATGPVGGRRSVIAAAGLLVALLAFGLPPAAAQAGDEPPADVAAMIRDGMLEGLDSRLSGGRTPREKRWLAEAARNKAALARDAAGREASFAAAARRYQALIDALSDSQRDAVRVAIDVANARLELAGMIFSQWAAAALDELEVTQGQRGDRKRVLELMNTARAQIEQARAGVAPYLRELRDREEEFLAMGVHDALRRLRADVAFHLAWCSLYAGQVNSADAQARAEALKTAEENFRSVAESGQSGPALQHCYIGLGVTLREQKRYEEAVQALTRAVETDSGFVLSAQARYELCRAQILAGQFDAARQSLAPLLTRDPDGLPPEQRGAALYLNLAALWEANSYLEEAAALLRGPSGSSAAASREALRIRELGLVRMSRLAARGGPWPGIVQLYTAGAVDTLADPATQSPLELLFTATRLSEARRYRDAAARLQSAAERPGVDPDLLGQILFDLGVCHYRLGEDREAARVFGKLAAELRSHPRAPQSAGFAYQLWVKVAEASRQREDYDALAATLLNLVQAYPQHERRMDAMWGLPLALQAADRFDQAAAHFGSVPPESPHWEEAQFRRVVCQRLACEAQREKLAPPDYLTAARRVAGELIRYSREALNRAPTSPDPATTLRWSAEALVGAGEVLISPGVEQYESALAALEEFDQTYPNSPVLARALAVRLRAFHARSDFDRATQTLDAYLKTAPAGQSAALLALLASGMQDEVARLEKTGEHEAARALAANAVRTFQPLEARLRADPQRRAEADAVAAGLAQMLHVAGQSDQARTLLAELLSREPKNGHLRLLNARVTTAIAAPQTAAPETIAAAVEAWAALLTDPGLRQSQPEVYWEARYHWLALQLRQGRAADVRRAIEQERVWYPHMGGPAWSARFDELDQQAAAAAPR